MGSDFLPQEIIRKKRDGFVLDDDEIRFFVDALSGGSLTEGQAAAFAMAVFFRGMNMAERVTLTQAMTRSGDVLSWKDAGFDGPVVDKHSSGGVGDKVSLMLAPILAACGTYVPMISGRGLGHTGGTLDKLDSIPGYDTAPDLAGFRRVVADAGCAIIGQTAELAPADRRLYGIRDVTATVESIPLITASILSKKLASGLDALVMDVKFGNGAFAATLEDGIELARSIVAVGNGAGMRTSALLTDMNQVLGRTAGNAVEVREAIVFLTEDNCDGRLAEVTLELAAALLVLSDRSDSLDGARAAAGRALESGAAAERFGKMVAGLGGPADLIERPDHYLPSAPVQQAVEAEGIGMVTGVDTRGLGIAVVHLGGGRTRADQAVDHAVGLTDVIALGEAITERPLAVVHARTKSAAAAAATAVRAAITLSEASAEGDPAPIVARRLTEDDL